MSRSYLEDSIPAIMKDYISQMFCYPVSLKTLSQVASSIWQPLSTFHIFNTYFPAGLRLDVLVSESFPNPAPGWICLPNAPTIPGTSFSQSI